MKSPSINVTKPFIRNIVLYFLIATFLLGIYYCIYSKNSCLRGSNSPIEGFANTEGICPDLLVRSGEVIVLYNSKNAVPPVVFKSIDEYTAYLEKQRQNGLRCPVLYLQEENNAQGETIYRVRPTLDGTQNGLPATTTLIPGELLASQVGPTPPMNGNPGVIRDIKDATLDNPPYNHGGYTPFDPYGQNIGDFTKLDDIHHNGEKMYMSDNPMDSNWGGADYSKAQVDKGIYDGNTVVRPVLITPKN